VETGQQATVEVANMRSKNVFLEERVRHLDEQVRSYE
jgi:hypothetical protein